MQELVLIFTLLCAPSFAQAWSGDVLTVHDGDTVRVQPADGEAVSIRVYGVDCPELGQPYGTEARNMTAQLLNGRRVEIIPAQTRKSYKREVAGVVLLDDMIVLQDALISAGLAWVDNRFCRMGVCDLWRQLRRTPRPPAVACGQMIAQYRLGHGGACPINEQCQLSRNRLQPLAPVRGFLYGEQNHSGGWHVTIFRHSLFD